MRWLTALFMLVLCHGTVGAEGRVGGLNLAKPSYANLNGRCKLPNQVELMLIKGYLVFETGFIYGRVERLDDLLFVIHQNISHSIGEDTIRTSVPILLYTKHNGGQKLSFVRRLGDSNAFDCDFSIDPYSTPSK